jgi:WD40 repeat protein
VLVIYLGARVGLAVCMRAIPRERQVRASILYYSKTVCTRDQRLLKEQTTAIQFHEVQVIRSYPLCAARSLHYADSTLLALYRDETKLHSFRGSQASKSSIDIYSCAGKLIRRINWDKGSIKGLGWSEDEKLLVITADGTVRCYYDLQGDFTQFSLGNGAEEYGVTACR